MSITPDKQAAFEEAAAPLMKYLAENFHPHIAVIVRGDSAVLMEGVIACTPEGIERGAARLRVVDSDGPDDVGR